MPPTPTSGTDSGRRARRRRSTSVDCSSTGAPDRPPASLANGSPATLLWSTVVLVAITPSTFSSPSTRAAASMSRSLRSGATFTSIGTRRPCRAASASWRSRSWLTSWRSAVASCSSRRPAVVGEEMLTVM
ncbi:hypothetical protein G6F24_016786 [Rhizopus arrhizus]|nr:hypothetical protein G6F24_016786 [Rhizopus arrhizus]